MSGTITRMLFVAHTGQISGAEKVLLDLVREAMHLGYRVVVACPEGPLVAVLPDGCGYLAIPPMGLGGETGLARVRGMIRLASRWRSAGRLLAGFARAEGTKTVVNSMYALPAMCVAKPLGGAAWLVHDTMVSAKQRATVRIGRGALRRCVAVSEATAAPLRAAGLPVAVAQNGVPWPVPHLGGAHTPPVVGMLALLTPWKGQRVLLEAAALLADVEIELAGGSFPGDRVYVAELEERAGRPDLAGRVRFLGHIDPAVALSRWDAVVSASLLPEAGPLGVLEAMSYGVPVIGSDHGGTREFLSGGAGVLVPPGDSPSLADAIERILIDDELRHQISEAARARVAADHNIAVTLPRMLNELLS